MVNINLLPPEDRSAAAKRSGMPGWFVPSGMLLILALAMTSFSLRQMQEMSGLRQEIRTLDKEKEKYGRQLSMIQEVSRKRDELGRRLQAASVFSEGRGEQVEIMTALAEALPPGVWLVKFSEETGQRAHLEGRALSTVAVFSYMTSLEQSGPFGNVALTYLKRDTGVEGGVAQFAIELSLT